MVIKLSRILQPAILAGLNRPLYSCVELDKHLRVAGIELSTSLSQIKSVSWASIRKKVAVLEEARTNRADPVLYRPREEPEGVCCACRVRLRIVTVHLTTSWST